MAGRNKLWTKKKINHEFDRVVLVDTHALAAAAAAATLEVELD